MQVNSIEDLPHEAERAVIINVGTDLVATLALASAVAHCSMPILLINCDPVPESRSHFDKLRAAWDFDVLEAPRRSHGRALDRLFRRIKADSVLLLDSDAEIRDPAVIEGMRVGLQHPVVFGAGYVQGPGWLGERQGCGPNMVLYEERPWMPWVLFRTDDVRRALAAGVSFEIRVVYNDFRFSKALSRQLAKRLQTGFTPRSRIVGRLPEGVKRRLRASALPSLRGVRQDFYGLRPNLVYLDTGADIYQWCKYHGGKRFSGPPYALLEGNRMVHYQGVTRRKLYGDEAQPLKTPLADIESEVRSRLRSEYGFTDSMVPSAVVSAATV